MVNTMDNNDVILSGIIESPFFYNNSVKNKRMFASVLCVERLSGNVDKVPLRISEDDLNKLPEDICDKKVYIQGNINSAKGITKSTMNVRVKYITKVEDDYEEDRNIVTVSGVISRVDKIRSTAKGIAVRDFEIISINYYGKEIHIPIVAWDMYAIRINENDIGVKVSIIARFQSRQISTIDNNGNKISKTIYELAAQDIRYC